MTTPVAPPIRTMDLVDHVQQFAAEPVPAPLLLAETRQFVAVAVEQLYPLYRQGVPPSRATGHSLVYITSGQAHINIGNDRYVVGPGEVMLTRAGQLFSFAPGDVTTGIVCHFQDALLLGQAGSADARTIFALLHFWGHPVIHLPPPTVVFVEQLFRRLLAEYAANQVACPALIRAYLLALLHELDRAYAAETPAHVTAAFTLTAQFKQLVITSLSTTHRVGAYAALLCVSTNHLSKCVRRVTGQSPAKWIEEILVLEAKTLLFQSNWSVGEVAEAVGMPDASYFSRLFKKHTGLTPLAFRKGSSLSY